MITRKKTAIVILGMHRSGTSSLAGSLQQKGLYLGKVMEKSVYNPKGNRESPLIINLNNDILHTSDGSWDNPPLMIRWEKRHQIVRDEIINSFSNNQSDFFGFKDPRTLLTLDFWNEALDKAIYIASIRNPISVALSLNSRNNMPLEKAFELWNHYNKILLKLAQSKPVLVVNFDSSQEEYLLRISAIAETIGLSKNINSEELDFYDHNLLNYRREDQTNKVLMPGEVLESYNMLLSLYDTQRKS